jgi:hypothetical protein
MYMYMPLFNTGQGCFPPFSLVAGAWRRQIEVGPNHNLYLGQYPLLLEMLVELPVLQESLLPNPWGDPHPLFLQQRLCLAMWKVSSVASTSKKFWRRLARSFPGL